MLGFVSPMRRLLWSDHSGTSGTDASYYWKDAAHCESGKSSKTEVCDGVGRDFRTEKDKDRLRPKMRQYQCKDLSGANFGSRRYPLKPKKESEKHRLADFAGLHPCLKRHWGGSRLIWRDFGQSTLGYQTHLTLSQWTSLFEEYWSKNPVQLSKSRWIPSNTLWKKPGPKSLPQ